MPVVTSVTLILAGGVLCLILVQLVRGGRYLAEILLASYLLRVALTLGFYLVSEYEIPIFRSLQLPGGFWQFTYDAPSYHANGARIAEALRLGTELPQVMSGGQPFLVDNYEFFYFVGLVYWAFGAHPLYVPLLNAMLWTAIAVFGYTLAYRIKGEDAGRLATALISFWPSAFIWSSQILKDSLVIFLLLLSLYLVIRIWEERRWVVFPAAVVLVPVVFLLAGFRFYLVAVMVPAVAVSLGLTLGVHFRELRWGSVIRALALIGLLWVPSRIAQSVDPLYFLFSARPESVATRPSQAKPETSPQPETKQLQSYPEVVAEVVQRSAEVVQRSAEVVQRSIAPTLQPYSIDNIDARRWGYATSGGASNVATDVRFRHLWDMVAFLPRGLAYALYAPFPWQWFSPEGDTGVFKAFGGVETLLMFVLTPFLLVGILRASGSGRVDAWVLLGSGTITLVVLALTVTNLGILFRLRLQALIPLFILVSAFGLPAKKGNNTSAVEAA